MHSIIELGLLWFGATKLFEYIWNYLDIDSPPRLWGHTVATGLGLLYLIAFLCLHRQMTYQQRIDEMAEAKKKLEEQVLKNRHSTKKPSRTR